MFRYSEKKIVPFQTCDLFNIVLDVESYPEFLPWASHAKVYEKRENAFLADLSIGYQWLNETYTSQVLFEKNAYIHIKHIKGAFKTLTTNWKFQDLGTECEVIFAIEFELKSSLYQSVLKSLFTHASHKIIQAFEKRARTTIQNLSKN